jgi:hypothetical protein
MDLNTFVKSYPVPKDNMLFPAMVQYFPTEIKLDKDSGNPDDASAWLADNIQSHAVIEVAYRFFFKHETDALQFKLVWGGEVRNHGL